MRAAAQRRNVVEVPTLVLGCAVQVGWLGLLALHAHVPAVVFLVVAAYLGAVHLSLQHEAMHGHPFRSRRANTWFLGAPLSLWLPYARYREEHLRHHRQASLTDPLADPESWYVTAEQWRDASPFTRSVWWCRQTLLGRLIIGPPTSIAAFLVREARTCAEDARIRRIWLLHLVTVVPVVAVVVLAGVPVWQYVLGWVLGGSALSHLRGFAEHRPVADGSRSAVVRSGPVLSMAFLNNNLHHAHHERPGVPWYELPALAERLDSDAAARAGAGWYAGYGEIVRRYAFRPVDHPVHPDDRARVLVTDP